MKGLRAWWHFVAAGLVLVLAVWGAVWAVGDAGSVDVGEVASVDDGLSAVPGGAPEVEGLPPEAGSGGGEEREHDEAHTPEALVALTDEEAAAVEAAAEVAALAFLTQPEGESREARAERMGEAFGAAGPVEVESFYGADVRGQASSVAWFKWAQPVQESADASLLVGVAFQAASRVGERLVVTQGTVAVEVDLSRSGERWVVVDVREVGAP